MLSEEARNGSVFSLLNGLVVCVRISLRRLARGRIISSFLNGENTPLLLRPEGTGPSRPYLLLWACARKGFG